jgi:hypothetical protein
MSAPLWQILLKVQQSPDTVPLDCEECFLLLEFMINQLPTENFLNSLGYLPFSCVNIR